MLISNEEYLKGFKTATSKEKQEYIDHMTYEEAELLHDNGYNVYLYDGEVSKVEKRDTKESWYATGFNENNYKMQN